MRISTQTAVALTVALACIPVALCTVAASGAATRPVLSGRMIYAAGFGDAAARHPELIAVALEGEEAPRRLTHPVFVPGTASGPVAWDL